MCRPHCATRISLPYRAVKPEIRPLLSIESGPGVAGDVVRLSGQWTALALALDRPHRGAAAQLRRLTRSGRPARRWDLSAIERLDHVGGQALWRAWGGRLPDTVELTGTQRAIFARIAVLDARHDPVEPPERLDPVTRLGFALFRFGDHLHGTIVLFGRFVLHFVRAVRRPSQAPWTAISANIYAAGAQAMPITALVGFLIGVVLSYLSAQQLKTFGASPYIVNLLGLAVIRELGPVLAAILVAGRSGSAITAKLGVMRVTEELDAMRVMGISHGERLILPRVVALAVAMPLLVVWTDLVALIGGMLAAWFVLDVDYRLFVGMLPSVVPLANLWIGLAKGVVFGMLIALVACHFGLRIKPNTQSLGEGTTASVVASITVVILADAVFAILFRHVGLRP